MALVGGGSLATKAGGPPARIEGLIPLDSHPAARSREWLNDDPEANPGVGRDHGFLVRAKTPAPLLLSAVKAAVLYDVPEIPPTIVPGPAVPPEL